MAIPVDRVEQLQDTPAWEYMTFDLTKPKKDIGDLNRLGRDIRGYAALSRRRGFGCSIFAVTLSRHIRRVQ